MNLAANVVQQLWAATSTLYVHKYVEKKEKYPDPPLSSALIEFYRVLHTRQPFSVKIQC